MPLPTLDTTPPVTNTYFVMLRSRFRASALGSWPQRRCLRCLEIKSKGEGQSTFPRVLRLGGAMLGI
jgi:hypothetical protein